MIRFFTDGACSENPGPGGWATLVMFEEGQLALTGNEVMTTNNRMELMAAHEALAYAMTLCSESRIEIHSDSAYVVNAFSKGWLKKWESNGWKTTIGKDVKNRDLWASADMLLHNLKIQNTKVSFVKVKGHSGNSFNEKADELAKAEVELAKRKKELA